MPSYDTLLTSWLLEYICDNLYIPAPVEAYMDYAFTGKQDQVDHIYYTGINCNQTHRHTVDEFVERIRPVLDSMLNSGIEVMWYEYVVYAGASVMWKTDSDVDELDL